MSHTDAAKQGWMQAMGIQVVRVSPREASVSFRVGPEHLQPAGLVHGGVFSGVIETVCSLGALAAAPEGQTVVGVENHTSFLRPVQNGQLTSTAVVVHSGRRTQLWQADVVDEQQHVVATGRVRLFCVPQPAAR